MPDNVISLNPAKPEPARPDISKGGVDTTVSRQWAKRPADQRFLSLDDLYAARLAEAEASRADTLDTRKVHFVASSEDAKSLSLVLETENGTEIEAAPTHYSFGQICNLVKAPAKYLRGGLHAHLAAACLQWGYATNRAELVKSYVNTQTGELKAMTGPNYGRIYDHELIEIIQQIAGSGTGDAPWKVPGAIDWSTGLYQPDVDVTTESTTLYASDRDCFVFLVDDKNPIEIGLLPDGRPDVLFRGFYAWNSEVGDQTLGVAEMLMRGVCQNRILWGVQDASSITLRHSKLAPTVFRDEVAPALLHYAQASTAGVKLGIEAARAKIVAKDDAERLDFLASLGLGQSKAKDVLERCLGEEGHPASSVWDFVQGLTAAARDIPNTNDRVLAERVAGDLMRKVAA